MDTVEQLAGVSFRDPYRWLEDATDEVCRWQSQQADLAFHFVRQWPYFDGLKATVARLSTSRYASVPRSAGGRWFRTHIPHGAAHSVALVADRPTGEGRVLYDPATEDRDKPPFLTWISPSPDGRVLAVGVCADGSENNTIRLVDVESGKLLPNPPTETLMDAWTGGAQWLADSSGFYFTALAGTTHDFEQRTFHYQLATGAPAQPNDVPLINAGRDYHVVHPASGGRWVVALQRMLNPIPVAVLDLAAREPRWRRFVTDVQGTVAGHVVGDRYVAVTDIGASRGRVIGISLDSSTPNDPATWEEIVPESDAVIRSVWPVGDHLYVTEFVDTYARVRIFTVDGKPAGEVPLPGRGAIFELYFPFMTACAPTQEDSFLFGFSTLTASWGTYRHRPGSDTVETLVAPEVTLEDAVVEDHWANSSDGSRIPYHVVRLRGASANQPRPALLYAYGGFNFPCIPQFPGPMAAFVAAGGLFVHCHLRGGGEYGLDWWAGGRLKNKQNCYHDLYAIAEDLVSRGETRTDLLAVTGASNGGLMAGVVAVQRPDLWRVVVPRVPLMDLIGACRDPYGRNAISIDFADPDDPDDVRRLAGFSPYHLIEDGKRYPAVYVDAGDTDPRCPPWHARKFAARLQAAQAGDAPILVHIWSNVGHGAATAKHIEIEEQTEWLAFVMQQLGMTCEQSSQ
jgi:prolyl oligopeptidase